MPAKSQAQYRFMKALENGDIKKPGLSKQKAKEYTSSNTGSMSYSNLPKLKKMMKNK
jgi:hypothetical protein